MRNKVIILICGALFSQTISTDSDPEDYPNNVDVTSQFNINQNRSRVRIQPDNVDEKWHYNHVLKFNQLSTSWRLDKYSDEIKFSNKKVTIGWMNKKTKVLLGNIKVELGQGYMFSSKYGRIKSYENCIQIAKQKQNINIDLSSKSDEDIQGGYFKYHLQPTLSTELLITDQMKLISLRWKKNPFDLRLTSTLTNEYISTSILNEIVIGNITLNDEIMFQPVGISYIINCFIERSTFKWLIQKRVLNSNHYNIFGKPYTALGGENENGMLVVYYLKTNNLIWSGWLDIFSQIQTNENQPLLRGVDYYFGVKYKFDTQKYLTLRFRNKNNLETTILPLNGIEIQYWEMVKKNKILLKYRANRIKLLLQLNIISSKLRKTESGFLSGFSTDVYETHQYNVTCGLNIYQTDSWDSRIYVYEPGLKGEFRIRSFYEKGYSIYTKIVWNPSPIIFFSARISLDYASHIQTNFQQNVAVQMDIVF